MRGVKVSVEDIERMVELKKEGHTVDEITKYTGFSDWTVRKYTANVYEGDGYHTGGIVSSKIIIPPEYKEELVRDELNKDAAAAPCEVTSHIITLIGRITGITYIVDAESKEVTFDDDSNQTDVFTVTSKNLDGFAKELAWLNEELAKF